MNYLPTAVLILPQDADRDKYVNERLTRGVIDIFLPRVGVIRDVRVGKSVLKFIRFPKTSDEYGSEVVYAQLAGSNEYIVTEVLPDVNDIQDIREDSDCVGGSNCSISIDMKNGVVSIFGNKLRQHLVGQNAEWSTDLPDGKIIRTALEEMINVMTKFGVMLTKSDSERISFMVDETGLSYLDYNGNKINIVKDKMELIGGKLVIVGDGSDVALLGNVTKQLFSDIIDQVSAITTTTAIGQMPIINKAQVEALKTSLNNILSTYLKLQ